MISGSKGQAEVSGNTMNGGLVLSDSSGTGPDEQSTRTEIEANMIDGTLFCTGNTPPPTK